MIGSPKRGGRVDHRAYPPLSSLSTEATIFTGAELARPLGEPRRAKTQDGGG